MAGSKSAKKAKVSNLDTVSNIKKRLHTSSVPESLPCREKEYQDIYCFLESKLRERVGGCMYISGVPGTGKTATVLEVIKSLSAIAKETKVSKSSRKIVGVKSSVPKFRFIEVNGLKLSDPYQAYTLIHTELTGVKVSSKKSCDALESYFLKGANGKCGQKDDFIVLMADELDLLCTKKQTILYHLFDWPNHAESNLIVIAIANAMDLPERVMMSRIASRLGLTRLTFQPYNHTELHEIIVSRLDGMEDCFDDDAIQLVSRKVAAVSGDARRALDICRRAVLIAENKVTTGDTMANVSMEVSKKGRKKSAAIEVSKSEFKVKVKDVQEALQEIFSSIKIVAIQSASELEQIFLRCIVQEFRSCGLEEATFAEVYKHVFAQTTFEGLYTPSLYQTYDIALKLFNLRLILLDELPNGTCCYLKRKIRLNVSTDDIDFALKSIQ